MGQITDVVKNLLIINVLIYFGAQVLLPNPDVLALAFPGINPDFQPFQLVTHMFMHSTRSLSHIMFNMMSLFFLGPTVERALGSKKFLILYMFSGLGALLLHLLLGYTGLIYPANIVGASGAIMGIFIAFALMFPDTKLMLLFIPFPIKAKYMMLGLIAFDLFSGVSGASTGIAHFAHLGGALFGFLIITYWQKYTGQV